MVHCYGSLAQLLICSATKKQGEAASLSAFALFSLISFTPSHHCLIPLCVDSLRICNLVLKSLQICAQCCTLALVCPDEGNDFTFCGYCKFCIKAERFGYVSKMQKFQLLFYDICLHQFFDLCCGQIGTVDFFMTAGTGTFNSLVVVLASEKIQVPYLRFSRHEHLQCSGHKHFLSSSPSAL